MNVTAVEIISVPADGGMAQFTVHRDGRTEGGHLSGSDAAPMVYQVSGSLDSAKVPELWSLVTTLTDSLPAERPPNGRGYLLLQLDYDSAGTARSWQYAWPFAAKAGDSRVQAIADWMLANRIGGW